MDSTDSGDNGVNVLLAGETIACCEDVELVVLKEIGAGTFGTTYMVYCNNFERLGADGCAIMAVKIPKEAATAEEAVFEAEVLSQMMEVAGVDCPTIKLIKSFLYKGKLALLMPLMQGDLRHFTEAALSSSEVFGLGRKIVKLLRTLHGSGVVHLDLKQDNILVSFKTSREKMIVALRAVHNSLTERTVPAINVARLAVVEQQLRQHGASLRKLPRHQLDSLDIKLGDLGLSCKANEIPRYPGGTLGYKAPEATYGGVNTVKLDLFGFGVMLAEMATGETLFAVVGKSDQEQNLNLLNQMADLLGPFTRSVIETAARRRSFFTRTGDLKARTAECPSLPMLSQWVFRKLILENHWAYVDAMLFQKILRRSLTLNPHSRSTALALSVLF